ncbi:MAG: CvpA family protein [Pseudomonadota bacterium]
MITIEWAQLNWFDLGIGVFLIGSIFWSGTRGIIREIISLLSWTGALFAVAFLTPRLTPFITDNVSSPGTAVGLSATSSFLIGFVIVKLLGRFINQLLVSGPLGIIDQSLGAVFGFARGCLIVSISFIVLDWFLAGSFPLYIVESASYPYITQGAQSIINILPDDWQIDSSFSSESPSTTTETPEIEVQEENPISTEESNPNLLNEVIE